ncbi:MAG: OmpH family outer membrane protein [Aquabacterium sp.]|nr:OmpH family outer membrane protein [Ferruginibacter sp.]
MKNLIVAMVFGISIFGLTGTAFSQSKIGYISTEELIGSMPEAEKANSELQEYQTALQQQGASYYKELNELDSLFARDSASMSKATKDLKRNDMIALYQKVQGWQQTMQQMIQEKQGALLGPIQKKAIDNIKLVAKESGYAYVFEAGSLLVSPPSDDMLPLVKKKMGIVEKAAAAPKAGAPKAGTPRPKQ